MMIYMGDQEDKELIFSLFGNTLIEQWQINKQLYEQKKFRVRFELYRGIKLTITNKMINDLAQFFNSHT